MISKYEKKYFLNPGTLSGAQGSLKQYLYIKHRDAVISPEFIILECLGEEMGVYKYKLLGGELIIEKCTISK